MIRHELTPSIKANPKLDRWIAFLPNRTVRIATGKVEMGQGIRTALRQIAAEELDIPLTRVVIASGDTDIGPDEMYTTSSLSVSVSGASIRLVAAEAKRLLTERTARRLNCAVEDVSAVDGSFFEAEETTGLDYWSVAPDIDWNVKVSGRSEMKPVQDYRIVGKEMPRDDLPAKLNGQGFLHDMLPDGVMHMRAIRQPNPGAKLERLDEDAILKAGKDAVEIYRQGDFVALISASEWAVEKAAASAASHLTWSGVLDLDPLAETAEWLRDQPAIENEYGEAAADPAGEPVELTVSRPYIAHAAIGPSAALARYDAEQDLLEILSHGQGMHPLRRNLALALEIDEARIHCRHVDGPGCYGHNGADDAALDAAIVALARPGQWIRAQWRREEEFGFEPVGPAMLVKVQATAGDDGRPTSWTTDIWSPVHVQRPGAVGVVMLGAQALRPLPAWGPPQDPPPERGFGGARNAFPLYDVGPAYIRHHLTERAPVRTSALRGLGALPNVYAIECLIDDLAAKAGVDPVAYRLSLLEDDPRARAVIERAAEISGWAARDAGGSGRGLGIGFARYKNVAAYAAVVVKVTVEESVKLDGVWAVADAGLAVNPNGVRNQLEGGCVQGASWALKEAVKLDARGIASLDWEGYPILRFSDLPDIQAEIIDRPDDPTLGVGECTVGPTAAAIGNAVAHALGRRINDMPLTRDRVMAALLADEAG